MQIQKERSRVEDSSDQKVRQEALERLSAICLGKISPKARNQVLDTLIEVVKNDNYQMGLQAIMALGQLASVHIQLMGPAQRERLVEALRWGMQLHPGNQQIEMAVKISCIRVLAALGIDVDREDAKKLLILAGKYVAPKLASAATGGLL
jgi:hypothetical protein